MTSCLRKILMCLVLLAFAWPWLKIRVMFGNDGEGVAARIICGRRSIPPKKQETPSRISVDYVIMSV